MQSVVTNQFNVTTLLGSQLNLSTVLPVTFPVNRAFTLNNHLNIFPNAEISEMPKLRYFGVGLGGCYNADDANLVSAYNPSRTNMNLYNLIPIRCVPVDEDLTSAERALYRLRQRKVMSDGEAYYLYYLKLLEWEDEIHYARVDLSTNTEEAYELDASNLTPTPTAASSNTSISSATSSLLAYYNCKMTVTADEILEYINVAYGGDTRYARISEIGYFSGSDFTTAGTTGADGTTSIDYTEAAYTQLYAHETSLGYPLDVSGATIERTVRVTSSGIVLTV